MVILSMAINFVLIVQNYYKKNKLKGGVVGTLMTNLAFEEHVKN